MRRADALLLGYARLVVRRPLLVLLGCIFTCSIVVVGAIFRGILPDFEQVERGFESRGTPLAGQLVAVDRALENAQCAGDISALPRAQTHHYIVSFPGAHADTLPRCEGPSPGDDSCRYAQDGSCDHFFGGEGRPKCAPGTDVSDCTPPPPRPRPPPPRSNGRRMQQEHPPPPRPPPPAVCSARSQLEHVWGVQLVFEREHSSTDLLSAASLRGMCELSEQVAAQISHLSPGQPSCAQRVGRTCCGVRSIGTYAAAIAGHATCSQLTEPDAQHFRALLDNCTVDFSAGRLSYASTLAGACYQLHAVFDSFNALLDVGFLRTRQAKYVKLMLPHDDKEVLKKLHLKFLKLRVGDSYGGAKLTAYTLLNGKVRTSLFNEILVETDIPRIVVGLSLVFGMMWLFTGSLFVTTLAFAQIGLSIAMAFGVYSVVLWLPFFPFINITGLFLCLGIGADDVFVMVQSFDDAIRARKSKTIDAHLVKEVLIDAGAATLVTSCTTAGAFFSSMSSSITAIKCFGLFCGLVVCCDWLTMIFFIPPVAVLYQRYVAPCCCRLQSKFCPNTPLAASDRQLRRPALGALFDAFLGHALTHRRFGWLWITLMWALALLVGLGSGFLAHGLPMASAAKMQFLPSDDPLERYCCVPPNAISQFTLGAPGAERPRYVALLFGVEPLDDSNVWDPDRYPKATLKAGTNLTTRAAQVYLRELTEKAHRAPWFKIPSDYEAPPELTSQPVWPFNTTFEMAFALWGRPCSDTQFVLDHLNIQNLSLSGRCCGLRRENFPFEPKVFEACLGDLATVFAASETLRTGSFPHVAAAGLDYFHVTIMPGMGLWFQGEVPKVLTFVLPTSFFYSESYETTHAFWTTMQAWADPELARAPPELRGGFVSVPYSQLTFYSLQTAMASSSAQSAWIALALACAVLVLFTRNVLVALYATLSILLTMLTVMGILTLCGWKQGIMESMIISCGIGMACDFTAHIGWAYRQANVQRVARDRVVLARHAFKRMAPALTAAALSTGIMGAMMTASGTIFTIRFGVFIVLLQGLGLAFAVFFLLPLLAVAGPLEDCGELRMLFSRCGPGRRARTAAGVELSTRKATLAQRDKRLSGVELLGLGVRSDSCSSDDLHSDSCTSVDPQSPAWSPGDSSRSEPDWPSVVPAGARCSEFSPSNLVDSCSDQSVGKLQSLTSVSSPP